MLGYKSNWQECSEKDLKDYFKTIISVLEQRCALIIFRIQEGFDFSEYLKLNEEQNNFEDSNRNYMKTFNKEQSTDTTNLSMIEESTENTLKSYKDILKNTINLFTPKDNNGLYKSGTSQSNAQSTASLHSKLHRSNISSFIQQNVTNEIPKVIFRSMNQFQVTQKTGTIDIWWLYDTGKLVNH